jgi:molecular chaperone GrpE
MIDDQTQAATPEEALSGVAGDPGVRQADTAGGGSDVSDASGAPDVADASDVFDASDVADVADVSGGPGASEPDGLPDLDTLSARAAERDEYLAMAQRTRADFENYRKRVTREAAGAEARATVRVVRELLPAIDNLGRALAAATREAGATGEASTTLAEGMRLVQDELLSAFTRVGVESYEPVGERFDPTFHEAIAQHHVPGAEPGTVVEVYQSGYRLDGSVIRPARVVVAGEPPAGAGDSRES